MFHILNKKDKTIIEGYKKMSGYKVSFCSIARDCEKNLRANIQRLEILRSLFLDSEIIIFENDSKDKTKEIIESWKLRSRNLTFVSEKYNNKTIPDNLHEVNPFFSRHRIEKMCNYRNKYIEILNKNEFDRDFVIVIDLDIAGFELDGVAHSFGLAQEWSCITSNGTSLSRRFTKQYHDSYALIEIGKDGLPIDEYTIKNNRKVFSCLNKRMPLFPVVSAFGGLAIYKWNAIKGKVYSCISNDDKRVQVLCEHISLNRQIEGNVFINPKMKVKYRNITLSFIINYLGRWIRSQRNN